MTAISHRPIVYRRARNSTVFPGKKLGEANIRVEYGGVELVFAAERGYGDSHYDLRIHPASFEELAHAMMQADPNAAIKAFGAALQAGIPGAEQRLATS